MSVLGRFFSVFLVMALSAPPQGVAQTAFPLNDTGMTQCSNGINWGDCAGVGDDDGAYPRQDGRFGRDNAVAAGAAGKTGKGMAGFDYTRVCNNGLKEGEGNCKASAQDFPGAGPDDWGCVRDNVTGLLWKIPIEASIDWHRAAAAAYPPVTAARAGRLCGAGDWRLPERHELVSLVHNGKSQAPYIDTVYFPGTPERDIPALFWSGREYSADAAWYVYFGFGGSGIRYKTDALSVRLVSGARIQAKYIAVDSDTVFDATTGLFWDRCALGQSGSLCDGVPHLGTWREALAAAVEANRNNHKGYNDWRLPNKNELESLVDLSREYPAVDTGFFPQTPAVYFWSGTPVVAFGPDHAWTVLFSLGAIGIEPQNSRYPVRLVRGGDAFASFDRAGINRGTLAVSGVTHNGAILDIGIDGNAIGSFLVLPASMPMPTAGRIAASGQSHDFVANVPQRFRADGLFPGTAYRVWFVARRGENFSSIAGERFVTLNDGSGVPVCNVGEGATLGTDCVNRVAAGGTPAFCLPPSGAATLDIDGVRYTLTARSQDACLEIVAVDGGGSRAPLLRRGSAPNNPGYPGVALLAARNGDIVRTVGGDSRIFADVDPVCTSTRIAIEAGQVAAPPWMTSSRGNECPADALTPPRSHYALGDGALACPAAALTIRGTYRTLSLTGTLDIQAGQQVFYVAYLPATENSSEMWFQATRDRGWLPFGAPFDPFHIAAGAGTHELPLLSRLDVTGLPANTELYLGYGGDVGEMMANRRYCGFFTLAK